MEWALKFEGINDYASFSDYTLPTNADIILDIIFTANTGGFSFVLNGYDSGDPNRFYFGTSSNGSSLFMRCGNASTSFGAISFGTRKTYTIEKRVNSWEVFDGVTSLGTLGAVVPPNPLRSFSFDGSGFKADIKLISARFIDVDDVEDRHYDATASNHGSGTPALLDTTGGNNATGVNMPTDGSAWINLGGSISIPVIMNQLKNQGIS